MSQALFQFLEESYSGEPGETISTVIETTELTSAQLEKAVEPVVRLGGRTGSTLDFLLQEKIGAGGMGVVHSAVQDTLGREVALKRLLPDRRGPRRKERMIDEATVLGRLDHPNILPLYLVGFDTEGLPALVMKRVRGVPWSDLITEPEHPMWDELPPDRLEWSLRVMVQICNAVAYAHDQGILHRDIKPANVMIGSYGEVYLFDWGLAHDLGESDSLWTDRFAGTPNYAAPEMFDPDAPIDRRTDVYLLGATLTRILRRKPLHTGRDLHDLAHQAMESEPVSFPDDSDEEIVSICHRACHCDPAERYQTAAAMSRALEDHLAYRGARSLMRSALVLLEHLTAELKSQKPKERDLHRLFFQCRFAFRQVQEQGGDQAAARAGLLSALELMARHELAMGELADASRLIEELDELGASPDRVGSLQAALAQAISQSQLSEELSIQIQYKMMEKLVQMDSDSQDE